MSALLHRVEPPPPSWRFRARLGSVRKKEMAFETKKDITTSTRFACARAALRSTRMPVPGYNVWLSASAFGRPVKAANISPDEYVSSSCSSTST